MTENQSTETENQTPPVEVEPGEVVGGDALEPTESKANPIRKFVKSGPAFDLSILDEAVTEGNRHDLKPKRDLLVSLVGSLTDDKRRTKIAGVRSDFEKKRVIDTAALDEAVADNTDDADTLKIRNKIRQTIKSLPEK